MAVSGQETLELQEGGIGEHRGVQGRKLHR